MSWSPQVPPPMLADPNLSDAEVRVLIAVIAHVRPADGKMFGWPGNARLAAMTGKDERTVRRLLASLETGGYIRRSVLTPGGKRTIDVTLPYDGWSVSSDHSGQERPGGEVTDDRGGRSRMTGGGEVTDDRQKRRKGGRDEVEGTQGKKPPPPPVPGGACPPTVPLDGVMESPVVFDAEPIHDDLDIPPLDAKPPPRNGAGLAAQVAQVYDHWRSYHPQAAPRLPATAPEARKAKLAFAAGHTVESLAKSIDGYHRSPFHNGVNDRGTKYLSLGLILRDESHIADGIAMADDPLLGRGMSERERKGVHATQAWLARHGADTAPADPWRTPE